ncbi:MAG: HD domain-containing protein, partial [Candidatus Gracilibacteria bacterium]
MKSLQSIARSHFTSSRGSHDWEHTLRVRALALHIGQREHADLEIIELAALLHDIARAKEDEKSGSIDHAVLGAKLASKILKKLSYPKEKISRVAHCIECHRFRNKHTPKTLEAKVLFDADKLDSIGAVGIGRAFLFAGEIGAKLHNHKTDLSKTKAYTV